ncbi:conserved hypothetical protein [Culex quinquefasciatus]|uniref:Glomulin n=1 Tax=Culex quinquefasciatus TaxID=7176 RepID=B0WWR7_CULQU|nr:conserved hypothetical protein [Culex quinquefasciatus]|eukprot:XP_001861839.1 conserved hypothetical protein [Culex quinquefasciatus]
MSLVEAVQEKLQAARFKDVAKLLRDETNRAQLQDECMDVVSVLADGLVEGNEGEHFDRFTCCEDLLKLVAGVCSPQEILLEVLDRIESTKNDEVFTSLLKVLQVVLLRLGEQKARSLECGFNTILSYINGIKLPDYVASAEAKEERLIECDEVVRRILQLYMTVLLFLEPIVKDSCAVPADTFKNMGVTRKNVIICFMLRLLDGHLLYLNARQSRGEAKASKTYIRQTAEDIVLALAKLLGDPLRLLQYTEERIRTPRKERQVKDSSHNNVFASEAKCPLLALAMYHYLLIGEDLLPSTSCPKVYSNKYIYEMCLHYCTQLIKHEKTAVQYKAILFAVQLQNLLQKEPFQAIDLDRPVHKTFLESLSNVIVYSGSERNRKQSSVLIRQYIMQFDPEGRYMVITNLFKVVSHNGLQSYIATIYKDLVNAELASDGEPSPWYSGKRLKEFLLKQVCVLKKGVETDLTESADMIISALNIVRFLLLRDKSNRTSIWNYVGELNKQFLHPLRKSIDLSRAHFEEEKKSVEEGREDAKLGFEVSVDVLNGGDQLAMPNRDRKLQMLAAAMNSFDLMDCLLARVTECVDGGRVVGRE